MLTLLLSLLACAPTCEDVEGAICEDELAALLEADTGLDGGWAWFDADGVQVTRDAGLLWEDADGVIWQVDPVGAVPYPLQVDGPHEHPWFESADCSGTAYQNLVTTPWVLIPAPPAFTAFGFATPSVVDVRVWEATDQLEVRDLNSIETEGGCSDSTRSDVATVPWDTTRTIESVPTPGWVPPMTLRSL